MKAEWNANVVIFGDGNVTGVARVPFHNDRAFVIAARTDVPALADALLALLDESEKRNA